MVTVTISTWKALDFGNGVPKPFVYCNIVYLIPCIVIRIPPCPQASWMLTEPCIRYE